MNTKEKNPLKSAIRFILVSSLMVMISLSVLSISESVNKETTIAQKDIEIQKLSKEIESLKIDNKIIENDFNILKKQYDSTKKVVNLVPVIQSRGEINDYDISRPSGRTPEDYNKLLKNSKMAGLGTVIYNAEKTYKVNGLFIIAVAQMESSLGNSSLSRTHNNMYGLNAWGNIQKNAYRYKTKADCIVAFCKIIRNNYLDKGRNTVSKIGYVYCENSSHWINGVKNIMKQKINLLK